MVRITMGVEDARLVLAVLRRAEVDARMAARRRSSDAGRSLAVQRSHAYHCLALQVDGAIASACSIGHAGADHA